MEEKLIQWLQERHPETDDTRGLSGVNTIDPALNIKQEREQASNYAIEASGSVYTLPGAVHSRFDRSKNPEDYRTVEALNAQRAREQTALGKASNAIWGGVASGLVTAAEDIYHIVNSLANAESFAKAELREKDAVLEFLGRTKEGIYNALPIYEMEKETALGEFFKWNSLRGMLDSIVGFALPGYGIGSGVKGLANLALRSARLGAYGTKLVQGATTFTSAYLMNLGETGIMNIELGELAVKNEVGRRASLILADKYNNDPRFARLAEVEATEEVENDNEFKAAVGQQQKDFALLNKAMIASDAFAIAGLFRLKGATRNIVKPAGVKKAFQEFLKTNPTGLDKAAFVGKYLISPSNPVAQNLKEAAEEMYQNAIQEQGLFELRRASGDLTEEEELFVVPKTNVGRLLKFGTSKQAVVEGLMGFFSGGLQRTMMQKAQDLATGDMTGTNRKTRINDLYDKQQEFDKVVKSKQAELLGYEIERAAAEASGDDIAVEHLEDAFFLSKAQEAINLGTIDMLYRNLEGIAKLTNEQAKELKLGDDYKQKAEDRIKELTKLEKTYLNINSKWANRKLTASEIFAKTLEVEHRGKVNTKYTQKLNTLYDEIAEDLRKIYGEVVPEDIIDILKSGDISSLNSSIQISLAANEKYDAIHDVKSKIKINQDLAEEATERLNKITSPEFTPEAEQAEIEAVQMKFNTTIADLLADKKLSFVYKDADKDMTLLVVKENDDYILHVVDAETGISEPLLNKKNEPIKFLNNIEEFAKNSNLQDVLQKAALEDLELEKLIENAEAGQKSEEQPSPKTDQVEASSPTIANIKTGDTYVLDNKEVEVVEVKDNSVKLKDDKGSITTLNSEKLTKLSIPKKVDSKDTQQSWSQPSLFDDAVFEDTGVSEIAEQKVVNSSKVSDHLEEESIDDVLEPAKRNAITYFFGTQGNIMAGQDLSSTPATRRWYDFVNAHSFGKGSDIRGKLVPLTESDINSLPPSYRNTYKDKQGKDQYYPQYRIFIVNSKGEYAHRNEKGEFIYKKSLDMNTAVFTFTAYMGHTFQYLQNSSTPRLRASVTEEEFNQARAAYIEFIKTTISKNKGYINFTGKSVGIWNERTYGHKQAQPLQPIKAIQPDIKKIDIAISIGGSVTFNLGNNQTKEVTAKRGSIVVFNREIGEASFGYSKPISKEHQEIILEFFRQLAGMVNSDGTIVNAPQGMWKMLATLTNYTKNNLRSNGTEIYTNANNKFHFITKNGKLINQMNIGGEVVPLTIVENGKHRFNPGFISILSDYLSTLEYNISKKSLESSDPYISYTFDTDEAGMYKLDKNGNRIVKPIKHNSYKEFLADNVLQTYEPSRVEVETINGETFTKPKRLNNYLKYDTENLELPTPKKESKTSIPKVPKESAKKAAETIKTHTVAVADIDATVSVGIIGTGKIHDKVDIKFKNTEDPFVQWLNSIGISNILGTTLAKLAKLENYSVEVSEIQGTKVSHVIDGTEHPYTISLSVEDSLEKTLDIFFKGYKGLYNIYNERNTPPSTPPSTDSAPETPPSIPKRKFTRSRANKLLGKKRIAATIPDYVKEDIKEAKKWFEAKFPNIEFEVIEDLVRSGQHGEFIGNAVKLMQSAEVGTTYHEAFHVVYNLFYTDKERKALNKAMANVPEFQSYIEEAESLYEGLSKEEIIEEALAELFRDYMLGQVDVSLEKTSLWQDVKNFFKDLLAYIGFANSVYKSSDYKRYIAKRMEVIKNTPEYKLPKRVINKGIRSYNKLRIKNLDYTITSELLNGVNFYVMNYIKNLPGGFEALFDKNASAAVQEATDYAKTRILAKLQKYQEDLVKFQNILQQASTPESIQEAQETVDAYTDYIDLYQQIIDVWNVPNGVYSNYLQYIKRFSLDIEVENNQEKDSELDKTKNQMIGDKNTIDYKLYMANIIRLATSSLVAVDENNQVIVNSIGLPETVPFGKVYNLLINRLSNITPDISHTELKSLLAQVAEIEPAISQLYETFTTGDEYFAEFITGNQQSALLPFDKISNNQPLTFSEETLLTKFIQTFGKHNKTYFYVLAEKGTGKFTVHNSNDREYRRRLDMEWASAKKKAFTNRELSKFYSKENGVLVYNPTSFKEHFAPISLIKDKERTFYKVKDALDALGYPVHSSTVKAISQDTYAISVLNSAIQNIQNGNTSTDLTRLRAEVLIPMEQLYGGSVYENSSINMDGNRIFNHGLHSFISLTVTRLNKITQAVRNSSLNNPNLDQNTLTSIGTELLSKAAPHLLSKTNSYLLKQLLRGEQTILLGINDGIASTDENTSKSYRKTNDVDRLLMKYALMDKNIYEILRPADNKQNMVLQLQNPLVSKEEIISGWHREVYNKIFRGYILDELAAYKSTDAEYTNFKRNHANRSFMVFGDLVTDEMLQPIKDDSQSELMGMDFAEAVLGRYEEQVFKAFKTSIDTEINRRFSELISNKILVRVNEDLYLSKGFGEDSQISKSNVLKNLGFYTVNKWAVDAEQRKLLFGELPYYKEVHTAFKRYKSALGPKLMALTSDWLNNFIEQNVVKYNNNPHLYHNGKPIVRSIVFNDIEAISEVALDYTERLDKDNKDYIAAKQAIVAKYELENDELATIKNNPEATLELILKVKTLTLNSSPYYNLTETDGFSYVTLDFYKTLQIRTGAWNNNKERLYQWEMQELQDIPKNERTYVDRTTGKVTPLKNNSWGDQVFNPLKPQLFGAIVGTADFVPTIGKMSSMPILPSVAKKFPKLAAINNQLLNNNVDIAFFQSANKGAATKLDAVNDLYNETGEITTLKTDYQDTYFEDWGIQLETGDTSKSQIPSGTQQGKQILSGLYEKGKPNAKFENPQEVKELVEEYLNTNAERLTQGKQILLKKLGGVLGDDGRYTLTELSKILDTISEEALSRAMSDSVFVSLKLLAYELKKTGSFTIDTMPLRSTIERLLVSISEKHLIKHKRRGVAAYQVPSTGFELANRTLYAPGIYKSNDLLSYTLNEDNTIKSMEVYLPHYLKGDIDPDNLEEVKNTLLAFRIPTQYISSIESLTIKGFLPKQAGDIVVLPSEIVGKAGSDFDIDKLYIFMLNTIISNGKTIPIDYNNWENQFNENLQSILTGFYTENLPEIFELNVTESGKKYKSSNQKLFEELVNNSTTLEEFINTVSNRLAQLETSTASEETRGLLNTLLTVKSDLETLKEDFYMKAVDNKLLGLEKSLFLLKGRVSDVLTPIQSKDLKAIATEINTLTDNKFGYDTKVPASVLRNESYLDNINKIYLEGADNIGPSALVSTFHIMAQIKGLTIRNANFAIKHNTTTVDNDREVIALGASNTVDGYQIADLLNQVLNGGVDVVNEPWAVDLGITKDTLSLFTSMILMGTSPYDAAYFIKNPAVIEYYRQVNKANSLHEQSINNKILSGNKILTDLIKKASQRTKETAPLTSSALKDAVGGKIDPKVQLNVLFSLSDLIDISSAITESILTTAYDTHGLGSTTNSINKSLIKTKLLLSKQNAVVIESTEDFVNNSYLTPYLQNISAAKQLLQPLFIFNKFDTFAKPGGLLETFIAHVETKIKRATTSEKERLVQIFQEDFVAYGLLTTPLAAHGNKTMATLAEEAMTSNGENDPSLAEVIRDLQSNEFYENNLLLKYLFPILTEKLHYIKPDFGNLDPLDITTIAMQNWEELMNVPYKDSSVGQYLMYQAIAQTGITKSPSSFIEYAPPVAYAKLTKELLDKYQFYQNINYTAFVEQFFLSHLNDTNLNSHYGKMRQPIKVIKIYKDEYKNKSKADLKELRSKGVDLYKNTVVLAVRQGDDIVVLKDSEGNNLEFSIAKPVKGINRLLYNTTESAVLREALNKLGYDIISKIYSPDLQSEEQTIQPASIQSEPSQNMENSVEATIKEGVSELFESNETLANSVYEALGFGKESNDISAFTNHSGGAVGSDTQWDITGKTFGMVNNKHYYFEGYKTPNGNTAIPINLKNEADEKLKAANKTLDRRFPTSKEYVNNLLRRNWWQVKNSDAIFAISSITDNKVDGGTGWAVHMAIVENKPVYVFDQNKNKWFTWSDNKFVETDTPALTKNFAGIGTRNINEAGKQAIKEVYEKTIKPQITPQQKQQAIQLYSQYLDTIFPDSKVKDIVYHGTDNKEQILKEGFKHNAELFESDDDRAYESGELGYGYYFATTQQSAKNYGEPLAVILNNPDITSETTYNLITNEKGIQHFVKSKEQIHILGSKQDIENFANFASYENSSYPKIGSIQQFKDYIMSKNFAVVEEFLVVNNKIDRKC